MLFQVRQLQILVGGQPEPATVLFQQPADLSAQGVVHPAAFDVKGGVPEPVVALLPAQPVTIVLEASWPCRLKRPFTACGQLFQKPVHPQSVEGVFEAGSVAILAVPEITLDRHYRFAEGGCFVRLDEADLLGQSWIAVLATVQLAHAAAHTDIETVQSTVFDNGDQTQILAVNVDVIYRRDGVADFEFPRKIKGAIDRFFIARLGGRFLVPDFRIGTGSGDQTVAGGAGQFRDPLVGAGQERVGATDHTAVVIAAGGDGVEVYFTKTLHQRAKMLFAYTVQLDGLPGRDADATLGIAARKGIDAVPLPLGQQSARNAQAHHELVCRLQVPPPPVGAPIPIILLIDSVELHQQWIIAEYGPG